MASVDVWNWSGIEAFLLDISGVLYNCGPDGGSAIQGSVDAVKRLKSAGIPVRFVTNETSCTRHSLVQKLQKFGFDLREEEVFPPAPAVKRILKERGLRPHLLVAEEVKPEFADAAQSDPNCLVIADAGDGFSYRNMNEAFQIAMTLEKPVIFSLGMGRFYKNEEGLQMDVGCFTKAMEYAVGVQAEVVGKPSKAFFESALSDLGLPPQKVVMIGDDIVSDVGGAQACGISGVQVRTGKFRECDENHPTVRPNAIVDNLAQAVEKFFTR